MKPNIFTEIPDQQLLAKEKSLKGLVTVIGIVWILLFVAFITMLIIKGIKNVFVAPAIPIMMVPILLLPSINNLKLIQKEIKNRNL